jgi:hypothetical protein
MDASLLLSRIIERGGLISRFAKGCKGDKEKTDQFIIACVKQLDKEVSELYWGANLMADLKKYAETKVTWSKSTWKLKFWNDLIIKQ